MSSMTLTIADTVASGLVAASERQMAREGGAAWLKDLRSRALARFRHMGLPSTRTEDWRYTNLAPLAKTMFDQPVQADISVPAADFAGIRVVVANGVSDLSQRGLDRLPEGVALRRLSQLTASDAPLFEGPEDHALQALNTALMPDALIIDVAPGTAVRNPILVDHIIAFAGEGEATHPRVVVRAGAGSSVTVAERFSRPGGGVGWVNPVCDIVLGEGAVLRLVTLVESGPEMIHTGSLAVDLARDSRFEGWSLLAGARAGRHDVRLRFTGSGASASLHGAALARGAENLTIFTALDHAVPHTTSSQSFRSVVDRGASTAFQGRITVRENAQKTDARLSSHNLLLDRTAEANTKPELEIFADDVKCSHGATVGQLDQDALFYLESRGIDNDTARAMLVEAFVSGVLENLPEGVLDDYARAIVGKWMAAARENDA